MAEEWYEFKPQVTNQFIKFGYMSTTALWSNTIQFMQRDTVHLRDSLNAPRLALAGGNYKIYDYQEDAPKQRMAYFHVPLVKEILVLSKLNLQNIAL